LGRRFDPVPGSRESWLLISDPSFAAINIGKRVLRHCGSASVIRFTRGGDSMSWVYGVDF
jgi:hypothetical protein